jgi:hypothetical protein
VYNGSGGTVANPVFSTGVTQNGLIYTTDPAAMAGNLGGPAGSALIGLDFSWALLGGATPDSATTLLASYTGTQINGDNFNWGQLEGPSYQTSIPGTSVNATVYLDLLVWEGATYSTYSEALAAGDYAGTSGVFSNPAGGGISFPCSLVGLPDVQLTGAGNGLFGNVPEPDTLALAALGGASLFMFRRKK